MLASPSARTDCARRRPTSPAVESLTFETSILAPSPSAYLLAGVQGDRHFTAHGPGTPPCSRDRHRHRDPAGLLRRRRDPRAAGDPRAAAVPRPDPAVRARRALLPRGHATRALGRLRAGLGGPGDLHRRVVRHRRPPSSPPASSPPVTAESRRTFTDYATLRSSRSIRQSSPWLHEPDPVAPVLGRRRGRRGTPETSSSPWGARVVPRAPSTTRLGSPRPRPPDRRGGALSDRHLVGPLGTFSVASHAHGRRRSRPRRVRARIPRGRVLNIASRDPVTTCAPRRTAQWAIRTDPRGPTAGCTGEPSAS